MTQFGITPEETTEVLGEAVMSLRRWQEEGLYPEGKYRVRRVDGRDAPGEKHEHCEYFVLDLDHDEFAIAALEAYAEACRASCPRLAADLDMKVCDARHYQEPAPTTNERGERP